jgi:hypothetical protein
MNLDCKMAFPIIYFLIFILVIILAGITIKEGTSSKKMVSWTLYSFSIIFGLIVVVLLATMKSDKDGQKKVLIYVVPILTLIVTVSNMVGMIISKPDLPVSQTFTPHFINVILLLGSIMIGYDVYKSGSANITTKK